MAVLDYNAKDTGLLIVDPYNDFISEGGKFWEQMKTIAEMNHCVPNMRKVLAAAREAKIRPFYALHHRYREGDYTTWKFIAPIQARGGRSRAFENGTWGGQVREEFIPQPGDIVAQEHWCSSGFYNTDLDLQLKRHGIQRLIVIGLKANTCIDATVRSAAELGYDVTLVKDAVASYSVEEMHAALEVNLPNYARLVTADEIIGAISGS
ncbi:MAG TPA: isochorismatase family cysteine hydrolase [Polyangiaceae bacterium]